MRNSIEFERGSERNPQTANEVINKETQVRMSADLLSIAIAKFLGRLADNTLATLGIGTSGANTGRSIR
jgi:hypothetical protein